MSLPRHILAGTTYLVTRRCTQRQFLLRPSRVTNEIVLYCLAVAAERSGVRVHAVCVLSNHWHAVLTDPDARLPAFMAMVDKPVAKAVNASLGRWENLFSAEPYSAVRLVTADDVLAKIVYVLANPVAAGLVRRARKWPGILAGPDAIGRPLRAPRPDVFFRKDGTMPRLASLALVRPPSFDNDRAFARAVADALDAQELALIRQAAQGGRDFLGEKAVRRQRVTDTPASREPRRARNPRLAARDKWRRLEAIQRLRAFVRAYREALERWRAGLRAVFPAGTYGLRVHAGVPCAPLTG